MITADKVTEKWLLDQTADATPGTRSSHAHGLGYAPTLGSILIIPKAPDNDTDNAPTVALVTVDATNVVVKSNKASATFNIVIRLDRDSGGRNLFV